MCTFTSSLSSSLSWFSKFARRFNVFPSISVSLLPWNRPMGGTWLATPIFFVDARSLNCTRLWHTRVVAQRVEVMAEKLTRIAIVNNDRCKPKKCRQECKRSCPVVRMGKLCIEVTPVDKRATISEELCIGCGICVKVNLHSLASCPDCY